MRGDAIMEPTTNVQEQVKEEYGNAARAVTKSGSLQACCDPGLRCCDPITTNLYSADQTGIIPDKAVLASLGCGNPTALIDLQPGRPFLILAPAAASTFCSRLSASVQPAKHTVLT